MEQLTMEIRKLVYTVICFQCLLQLTAGNVYHRYLKLFSHFLTMCMCCSILYSFVGQLEDSMMSAQQVYDEFERGWGDMADMKRIRESSSYYTNQIWNGRIVEDAYEQYQMNDEGGEADAGLEEKLDEELDEKLDEK